MFIEGKNYPFFYYIGEKIFIKKLEFISNIEDILIFKDEYNNIFKGTKYAIKYVYDESLVLLSLSMKINNLYRSYNNPDNIERNYKQLFDDIVDDFYKKGGIVLLKDNEITCEYQTEE